MRTPCTMLQKIVYDTHTGWWFPIRMSYSTHRESPTFRTSIIIYYYLARYYRHHAFQVLKRKRESSFEALMRMNEVYCAKPGENGCNVVSTCISKYS